MIPLSLSEVAEAVGGDLTPGAVGTVIGKVTVDSRTVAPGGSTMSA